MTPLTLVVDRRFRNVGRIKKHSGTTNQSVFRRMNTMLTELHDRGRFDILRAIRDGKLTLVQVHEAFQRRQLDALPLAETMQPLSATMQAWIDGLVVGADCSAEHKESLAIYRRRFETVKKGATVSELPAILDTLRESRWAKLHPVSFNAARVAALSFVRHTLKRSHPIWLAVAAVERRRVPKTTKRRPLTPDEMRTLFPHPETDKLDAIAWTMATTGMHQKELWGAWSVLADRIHIEGTKRRGRVRDVPLVMRPVVPRYTRQTFDVFLRQRTRSVTPYDFRRTFANWLESAGIPRTRRKLYLGHGTGDVSDLYEQHEVRAFLADDGRKIRQFLGLNPTISHTIGIVKA